MRISVLFSSTHAAVWIKSNLPAGARLLIGYNRVLHLVCAKASASEMMLGRRKLFQSRFAGDLNLDRFSRKQIKVVVGVVGFKVRKKQINAARERGSHAQVKRFSGNTLLARIARGFWFTDTSSVK